MIMMSQWRFINYNTCTTLVGVTDSGGSYAHIWQRIYNPNIVVVIDVYDIIIVIIIITSLKFSVTC